MKNRANWIAAGAFVAGVAGFQLYAAKLKAEVQGGEPDAVLMVTQDLAAGAILSEANLGTTLIPADYLDQRRVRAADKENLLGVQVQQALRAGDAVLWSDIADGAAHKHLASLVTPGRRAYTLDAGVNPLGRLLRVADHVDVLLESGGETETLLQHVLVLAVGGQIERSDDLLGSGSVGGSGVTLSVSSDQAETLLRAESRGELRLVLRNPEDQRKTTHEVDEAAEPARKVLTRASISKPEIERVQ